MNKDPMLMSNGFQQVNTAAYSGIERSNKTPTSMMNSTGGAFGRNEAKF